MAQVASLANQNLFHRHDDKTSQKSPSLSHTKDNEFYSSESIDHVFGQQFMMALTIAGMGLSLLVTVFSLFHVDVFLRVYRLPLHAYSTGNLIFTVVNTSNDVLGAYLLDEAATRMNRSDLIGISGCILSMFFL